MNGGATAMRAVISDIHGNLPALLAVLDDVAQRGITDVICLGGLFGYGPDPIACTDLLMRCAQFLLGPEDRAALADPARYGLTVDDEIYEFLNDRPHVYLEGEFQYVHGSPRDPLNEYVFPEDAYNSRKMERIFALVEKVCVHGHTHVPGVMTESGRFFKPQDLHDRFEIGSEKVLINVGSVGQPRCGDWRASYAILEGQTVTFRRLEYDVDGYSRRLNLPE